MDPNLIRKNLFQSLFMNQRTHQKKTRNNNQKIPVKTCNIVSNISAIKFINTFSYIKIIPETIVKLFYITTERKKIIINIKMSFKPFFIQLL